MSISAIHEFAKMASAEEVMWHEKTAGVAELRERANAQFERARSRLQRSKGHLAAAGKALSEDESPSILSRAAKGLMEHKGKAALGLGAAAAGGAYLHHQNKQEASKMASATRVLNVYEFAVKEASARDLFNRAAGHVGAAAEEAAKRGRGFAEQAEKRLRAPHISPLTDAPEVERKVSQAVSDAGQAAAETPAAAAAGGEGGSFLSNHGHRLAMGGGVAALGGAGYLAARRRRQQQQ